MYLMGFCSRATFGTFLGLSRRPSLWRFVMAAAFSTCGEWCPCFIPGFTACFCVRSTGPTAGEAVRVQWGASCVYLDAAQLALFGGEVE